MNAKQQTNQLIEVEPRNTALTPMDMLEKAIASGATVELMEKLMALQERWESNQARKAFDNAMADAKAEIPVIIKNQSVGYDNRSGGSKTSYMHEDMAQIARTIDPIIAKHGLSYRFRTTSETTRVTVTCVVSHREGHFEENSLNAGHDGSGGKNAIQGLGSALTYLQRYSLKAAFGLAASADDDGRSAGDNERPAQRSRVPSPSDAPARASADPEPPQGPQLVKGGKDASSWTELYLEAMLTSGDRATVMQWVDANQSPLGRVSADLAKKISAATEKHLAFLRKTAPKDDPISSGIPPKTAKGEMPNIQNYDEWIMWAVNKLATTDAGDQLNDFFESLDPFWADIKQPDREMLLGAKRSREDEQAP